MDVSTLITRCPGSAERTLGDPPALIAVGVAVWEGRPPAAWDGRRYVGDGHGLSLVLRGQGSITGADGVRRDLEPGTAIHHLPGRAASGVLSGPAAELWVAVGRSIANRLAPLALLRRDPLLRPGLDPGLLAAFAELHAGMRAPPRPGDPQRLLAHLLTWLHEAYARADSGAHDDAWDARIARTCSLLTRDLARPPDLAAIAAAIGTTPWVLRRRFGSRMGLPPLAWWRRQRLQHATSLLARHPVAMVARLVGYGDPTALAKQVRRQLGRTPRSFNTANAR